MFCSNLVLNQAQVLHRHQLFSCSVLLLPRYITKDFHPQAPGLRGFFILNEIPLDFAVFQGEFTCLLWIWKRLASRNSSQPDTPTLDLEKKPLPRPMLCV